MASNSTGNDSSNSKGKGRATSLTLLTSKITQLKKQIQEERADYVKEQIMKNKEGVESNRRSESMLSLRMQFPTQIIPRREQSSLEQDNNNEEVNFNLPTNLPFVEKIPRFTTYIHTARNLKITEDQSVNGRRRIYREQTGGEAMVCTDHSDEELTAAPAEEKHDFSDEEKRIIRMVSQTHEPSEEVVQILKQFIGGTSTEIREEFSRLKKKGEEAMNQNDMSKFLDTSLASRMHIYDTLFCRRCLVFNCRLHGIGQPVITNAPAPKMEQHDKPCGVQCYKCSYEDSIRADSDITTWKLLEKDVCQMGIKIFGKNSCLITKNFLRGLKTCMEVHNYINIAGPNGSSTGVDHHKDDEKLASDRRKRKGKRGSRHPARIAGQSIKQYIPCECNSVCGKDCPCFSNSTCCEKYCGCSETCKNRFRGCHCSKSRCRSQQCPCFAANRECDPDICQNCWVSCGGGPLGEPQRRGDGQCGNMRLLQRKKQRILLGISDVAGWGAFVKNTIEKDEYLGEYTGELISPEEADSRGQLYDRANLSFLFNLNDQYVVDALRHGNKLKFANHSENPNCRASIIKAGGDHHIGIFANRRIQAGEEINIDYCYEPEHTPFWGRNPDGPNGGPSCPPQARSQPDDPKKGPSVTPQARSKKPQARI